jgi:cytochrome oxidase Cu insertion factor (SCO1/SenC/PrrC family)
MTSKVLVFWLAVLLLFAGAAIAYFAIRGFGPPEAALGQEEIVDYGPPLESFELTQSTGETFQSESLDGQVWVVNFFYSTCPSICVQENLKVQELEREFGDRGVKFVSITCDAPTDTPSRLADYSQRFNAKPDRWKFLTGDQKYIERIGSDIFKVPMSQRFHSERLFVVDRAGELRGAYEFKRPDEIQKLRQTLNELLAEKTPAAGQANPDAPSESASPPAEAAASNP